MSVLQSEKAHKGGLLTDDQYKLIQLAAGKSASNDDKSEKIGFFKQILTDYYKVKAMQTQVQIDLADRAWEWLGRKVKYAKEKISSKMQFKKANEKIKEDRKWGNNEHHCDEYCEAVLKFANNSSFDSTQSLQKVEVSELDRFIEIVRNTVGASYDHTRSPTESKMDCSGIFVYAMQQLGYKIDKHLTAARMASGQISGIILYDTVDNGRQGNKGVLNFYKWGTSTVQHVNYGVGKNESETDPQIIDASEGDTWQTNRNKNEKQIKKAKKDTINQTWAPFSTRTKPDIQAYLDFSKFNKEIEIK